MEFAIIKSVVDVGMLRSLCKVRSLMYQGVEDLLFGMIGIS